MCGLFGFSRTTELTRLMTPTLAISMNQRGNDSWGVTDGVTIYKDADSIVDSFVDCELEAPSYHTRAASVGGVSERNAHPFHFEDKYIVTGMHNGHISNWSAIKDKYKRKDVEVDSEHIFMNIAEGKPVADFQGYGNVVWYEQPADKSRPMERYFSRWNSDALVFAQMSTGEIVYCSTKQAIQMAAVLAGGDISFFYKTEPLRKYYFKRNAKGEDKLYQMPEPLPWGANPVNFTYSTPVIHSHGGGTNRSRYGNDYDVSGRHECPLAGCIRKITDKQLVCSECFEGIKKEYGFGASA